MVSKSDDYDRRDRLDAQDRQERAEWDAWSEHRGQKKVKGKHQDLKCDPYYRRLAELRRAGYDEKMFSMDNPAHCGELNGIVSQLDFHRLPYDIVTVQRDNVYVLFLSGRSARLLGIDTKRNEIEGVLRDEDL